VLGGALREDPDAVLAAPRLLMVARHLLGPSAIG
jgi:hypothetical protein